MGKRSAKDKDNARTSRRQHQLSPEQESGFTFSPPTHLPTPLPEEERRAIMSSASGIEFADGDSNYHFNSPLIDFDDEATMDHHQQPFVSEDTHPIQASNVDNNNPTGDEYDEGSYRGPYRSPAFREAALPPDSPPQQSPPPLPVLPRGSRHNFEAEETAVGAPIGYLSTRGGVDESTFDSMGGHSREPNFDLTRSPLRSPVSPVYASTASSPYPQSRHGHSRTPSSPTYEAYPSTSPTSVSALGNFKRTIQSYSQPSVSKGVSFGLFSSNPRQSPYPTQRVISQPQEFERDYERYGEAENAYGYGSGHVSQYPQQTRQIPHPSQQATSRGLSPPVTHHPQPVHPPVNVHALSSAHSAPASSGTPGPGPTRRSGLAALMKGTGSSPSATHQRSSSRQGLDSSKDGITFARWDTLSDRRLLFLGYSSGFQIWDCTDLGSVDEALNINFGSSETAGPEWKSDGGALLNVIYAGTLSFPSRQALTQCGNHDPFEGLRPMIGILAESSDPDEREQEPQTTFILYSVRERHQLVKKFTFNGLPSTFISNEHFTVISTVMPPTLYILSSTTFNTLNTISSASLEPFAPPAFSSMTSPGSALQPSALSITISNALSSANKSVSLVGNSLDGPSEVGGGDETLSEVPSPPAPRPVFALSGRLLAYASVSPSSGTGVLGGLGVGSRRLSNSSTTSGSAHSVHSSNANASVSSSPFGSLGGLGVGGLGKLTQADVGHAALRVGESVYSGFKFLGGVALEAAKNKMAGGSLTGGTSGGLSVATAATGTRFVSRSAPDSRKSVEEEAERRLRERERRHSNTSSPVPSSAVPAAIATHSTTVAPFTKPAVENGYYVSVIDLMPLLSDVVLPDKKGGEKGTQPVVVNEFRASKSQPVALLEFSPDGMGVGVGLRDGHNIKVFQIRPTPGSLLSALASKTVDDEGTGGRTNRDEIDIDIKRSSVLQTYDLKRGRTYGVLERVDWAKDERWLAVGTRNRTVHVFAINPYGGKTDLRSHLEGRVRNVEFSETLVTTLAPTARLRGTKGTTTGDTSKTPLAFTFVSSAELSASPNLLPPVSSPLLSQSPSYSPSSRGKRGTNYQHVLMFDPEDGMLSLYRLTLDKKPVRESGISGVAASVHALGVASISLPGMGGAGRLSSSPSSKPVPIGGASGKGGEQPMELGLKETRVVATYSLQRERDWKDVSKPLKVGLRRQRSINGDWLAEAELSSCSTSQRVVPRSLYLSHQFSFHTLGEDYHALIRSYQFHIVGSKIEVRKAVEISAFTATAASGNATFIEGFSAPRDIHLAPSSFDEPMASAISGSFDHSNIPPILPMYPNGIPGSNNKSMSLRQSIPIRAMAGIGDGVSEGFGMIKRRVKSPQLGRSDGHGVVSDSVSLEFDEEDEDFLNANLNTKDQIPSSRETSRGSGVGVGSGVRVAGAVPGKSGRDTRQLIEADVIGSVDEDMFDGWAGGTGGNEVEQFDDLAGAGYLAEEQGRLQLPSPGGLSALSSTSPAKKSKKRR